MSKITFTLDLEDHQPKKYGQSNYTAITIKLLEALKDRNINATVFVLGEIAYANPELIQSIAESNHEIAYHSYRHTPLTKENSDQFLTETEKFKEYVYNLCNVDIRGFRAPVFSLTKETKWVLDILKHLGFTYSSSVLPAKSPLYGFSSAPRHPFKWGNGIIELPAPIYDFGPVSIPFLGGIYFRYIPIQIIKLIIKSINSDIDMWFYFHPHDFDYNQPYFRIPGTTNLISLLLWLNRKNTNSKLFRLIDSNDIDIEKRSFIKQIEDGKYNHIKSYEEII